MENLKRVQLFEFEDYPWFPNWLRASMTRIIVVLHKVLGISDVLVELLAEGLQQSQQSTIVDLGSGAGGAMPQVLEKLRQKSAFEEVKLIMTDLYPNPAAIEQFNQGEPGIQYHETPVDATDLASAPAGLKSMVNSFHHMPPAAARDILASAQKNKQAILIYEMAENKIPLLLWWLFLPLSLAITFIMALALTPFVKPLTVRQLFFTYLVPIIPLFYAWDGQASLPRMYTFADMDVLLKGLETDTYSWEKGYGRKPNGKVLGTYLLGMPKNGVE